MMDPLRYITKSNICTNFRNFSCFFSLTSIARPHEVRDSPKLSAVMHTKMTTCNKSNTQRNNHQWTPTTELRTLLSRTNNKNTIVPGKPNILTKNCWLLLSRLYYCILQNIIFSTFFFQFFFVIFCLLYILHQNIIADTKGCLSCSLSWNSHQSNLNLSVQFSNRNVIKTIAMEINSYKYSYWMIMFIVYTGLRFLSFVSQAFIEINCTFWILAFSMHYFHITVSIQKMVISFWWR